MKTKTPHWSDRLVQLGACDPAVRWARKQPSYAAAWKSCTRTNWLTWVICIRIPLKVEDLLMKRVARDLILSYAKRSGVLKEARADLRVKWSAAYKTRGPLQEAIRAFRFDNARRVLRLLSKGCWGDFPDADLCDIIRTHFKRPRLSGAV